MCGICGFAGSQDEDRLNRMIKSLVHRGPDDEGRHMDDAVSLGMRRLSVIDVVGGRQPIWNETRTVCVIMNGEIYNFRELRDRLIAQGHRFETKSDTEVLVHLYEEYGDACVEHLRGMFAFALWDRARRVLLLARDRLGIKPLFYAVQAGRLLFASEIKALLAGGMEPVMDPQSVRQYLAFLYVPCPATIYEGIHQVPPGHTLTYAHGEVRLRRYWRLARDNNMASGLGEGEAQERLLELLKDTIRLHLISDVPLGVFLSGGLDSSILVALMRWASDAPIKTFTVGYSHRDASYNELEFARLIADRFETDHHEEIIEPKVADLLPHVVQAFDQPFADSSAIPNYLISQIARRDVTVALAGHGGDELFGGYPRYLGQKISGTYDQLPHALRRVLALGGRRLPEPIHSDNWTGRVKRFLEAGTSSPAKRYLRWITFQPFGWEDEVFRPEFYPRAAPTDITDEYMRIYQSWDSPDHSERAMALDVQTYLPDDLLVLGDRMSMVHSLELRVPFCDHILVQFAMSLSAQDRLCGWRLKSFLKRALRFYLPDKILSRSKHGFTVPIARWFNTELRPLVRELLSEQNVVRRGIFNYAYIQWILAEHESGRRNFADQIYALLILEIWQRKCVENLPV